MTCILRCLCPKWFSTSTTPAQDTKKEEVKSADGKEKGTDGKEAEASVHHSRHLRSGSIVSVAESRRRTQEIRLRVAAIPDAIILKDADIGQIENVCFLQAEREYPQKKVAFTYLYNQINAPLFQQAHLLTCIADRNFTMVAITSSGIELCGFPKSQLLGRPLSKIAPTVDFPTLVTKSIDSISISVMEGDDVVPLSSRQRTKKATWFCIPFGGYYVSIINIRQLVESALQIESPRLQLESQPHLESQPQLEFQQYVEAITPLISGKQIAKLGNAVYFVPEFNHPAKNVFKKLVHALNAPVLDKPHGFSLICCKKELEILAMTASTIETLKFEPQEIMTKKIIELLNPDSSARFSACLSNTVEFERHDFVMCDNINILRRNADDFTTKIYIRKTEGPYFIIDVRLQSFALPDFTLPPPDALPGVVEGSSALTIVVATDDHKQERDDRRKQLPTSSPQASPRVSPTSISRSRPGTGVNPLLPFGSPSSVATTNTASFSSPFQSSRNVDQLGTPLGTPPSLHAPKKMLTLSDL